MYFYTVLSDFVCLQISTLCIFASLLEHTQCFLSEDLCLIFAQGIVSKQGQYNIGRRGVLDNMIPGDHVKRIYAANTTDFSRILLCKHLDHDMSLTCYESVPT